MKVVLHFDGSDALASKLAERSIELCPESDDARFHALLPDIEVLWHVLRPVSAAVIDRAPKLRLIQKIGSGVNTIDLDAAKKRGIPVCNLPGTNSRAVAEMTLLLMLACLRRLRELDSAVRAGSWAGAWELQDRLGEIGGRTVGLVGYGAVPRLLRPVLEAMGAKVLYWSRSARNADLEALLRESDIVSLHLPLSAETRNIVNPLHMKRGAILINTARGGLVDERTLLDALRNGHLDAAGLDTYASEPLPPGHALAALENVVLAPHIAWLTQETLQRSLEAAMENVRRLAAGDPLRNRVA